MNVDVCEGLVSNSDAVAKSSLPEDLPYVIYCCVTKKHRSYPSVGTPAL